MFYKPKTGGIWDPSVIYYNGLYYMCCMYFKDGEPRRDDWMWCAKSEDGVHWEDIGPVIEDRAGVCKMFLYETPDGVVADFGSFSETNKAHNDTLRYYISKDMVNWTYIGLNHPDGRWYETGGRWDHMYVYKESDKYYGYPVATPHPEFLSAWGLSESSDGIHWTVCKPPVIEWGEVPPIDCLEGGGMEKIGDKYYYIGGFVGYAGNYGYGLYTFVSDSPEGPFRPLKGGFRLCGFDRLPGRVFIQNLAAFVKGKDGEILISNAVDAGGAHEIWLLPMRKAVIGDDGILRQGYWEGNEKAKGREIYIGENDYTIKFSSYPEGSEYPLPEYNPSKMSFDKGCIEANTDNYSGPNVTDHNMIIMLDKELDMSSGYIFEGKVRAQTYLPYDELRHKTVNWRPASFGFFFEEEDGNGMDISLEIGHPYKRYSFTENIRIENNSVRREVVDTVGEDCANVRGMSANEEHSFKCIFRRNVFEVYLDGIHVQTFVHLAKEGRRIGFTLLNSKVSIYDMKLFEININQKMK